MHVHNGGFASLTVTLSVKQLRLTWRFVKKNKNKYLSDSLTAHVSCSIYSFGATSLQIGMTTTMIKVELEYE